MESAHYEFYLFIIYFATEDIMEEDSLNEKSCVQVLKILMDKADEEIVKLEEDIVMLQCQLAWDDEDWSKPCSAALREKIDHLDILIQSLKKENTEDVHYFGLQLEQPEKLAQRLHDLLKPLLENYFLVKSKQVKLISVSNPYLFYFIYFLINSCDIQQILF